MSEFVRYYGIMHLPTERFVPRSSQKHVWGMTGIGVEWLASLSEIPPKVYHTPSQAAYGMKAWLRGYHSPGRFVEDDSETTIMPVRSFTTPSIYAYKMRERKKGGTTVEHDETRKPEEMGVRTVDFHLDEEGQYFAGRVRGTNLYVPVAYPKKGGTTVEALEPHVHPPRLYTEKKGLKLFLRAWCAGEWCCGDPGEQPDAYAVPGRPKYEDMEIVPVRLSC